MNKTASTKIELLTPIVQLEKGFAVEFGSANFGGTLKGLKLENDTKKHKNKSLISSFFVVEKLKIFSSFFYFVKKDFNKSHF